MQDLTLAPESVSVRGSEVVFAIQTLDENRKPSTVWVRAAVDRAAVEQTLERRLDQLIDDLASGDEMNRKLTATPGTTATAVSADVKAVFCESREVAETVQVAD